jgi:hypothetical protein
MRRLTIPFFWNQFQKNGIQVKQKNLDQQEPGFVLHAIMA